MITREEYMRKPNNLHHAYYLQYSEQCKSTLENWIISNWSIETIKKCLEEDEYLNNLPGQWMVRMDETILWTKPYIARINKKTSGSSTYSYSDNVCMIKARMKEMVKESTK